MWVNMLLFFGALIGMEVVAFLTHKYLMHGPLWFLHESHHVDHDDKLERNDLFGIFFSLPSIALIYFGTHGYPRLLWVGLGMVAYGLLYFIFHDIVVHRRLDLRIKPENRYLKRIVQAHHIHHATKGKAGATSFGFLYSPPIERLKAGRAARKSA